MNSIRLIAMDMDGTLLNSRQELSAGNIAALCAAEEKGVKLAICSGRPAGDTSMFAVTHGFDRMAILSMNGGYCLDRPFGTPYADYAIERDTAMQCFQWFRERNMTFACFMQNEIAAFAGEAAAEDIYWCAPWNDPRAPRILKGEEAVRRFTEGRVNKFVCIERDREQLQALGRRLETLPGLEITSSWEDNYELMPQGVSKGRAVKELAEKMGIGPDQVMTVGDFDNDLSMIEYAGYGTAMGNATPKVKAAAKYVTLTNDEDGVAAAIRKYVL